MILALCCLLFLLYKLAVLWPERRARTPAWWLGAASAVAAVAGIGVGVASDLVAQKAMALLMLPAGLTWLLLMASTAVACLRRQRLLAWLAGATLAIYTVAGNAWLGDALVAGLERRIPPLDLERLEPFDAVFVLGGGTEVSDADGPSLSTAGDRIALAARLWHAGKARVLVASGSSLLDLERERDLAAEAAVLWRGLGVPATAIVQLPAGLTITSQEIPAYARLATERGWQRVGLVSSAWHLPRALRSCRRAGFAPVPLGADRRGRFRGWSPLWLIPQEHGFARMQIAGWEYLGMLAGR
jgi:uncharacterized SAM-binding protein YcdF (DUF218 family)